MRPTPETETPIPPDLLIMLHDTAQKLMQQESQMLQSWGAHLMNDWRGLELIAERYR